MASRYRHLPAHKTGCYINEREQRLEYWFVHGKRKAKVGECKLDAPQALRDKWEQDTAKQLSELIFRRVADGTLRLEAGAVLPSKLNQHR